MQQVVLLVWIFGLFSSSGASSPSAFSFAVARAFTFAFTGEESTDSVAAKGSTGSPCWLKKPLAYPPSGLRTPLMVKRSPPGFCAGIPPSWMLTMSPSVASGATAPCKHLSAGELEPCRPPLYVNLNLCYQGLALPHWHWSCFVLPSRSSAVAATPSSAPTRVLPCLGGVPAACAEPRPCHRRCDTSPWRRVAALVRVTRAG